jgi:group II intron reverse transcriptase/maturase
VTWQAYGENLEEKLTDLHDRIHKGSYRARPARRTYIPKADGSQRPLAILCLQDKVVQQAVAKVLEAIYEEDFIGFSYGFRPGRGQHDALDALHAGILRKRVNWVLDADIRGFYDAMSHAWIIRFLEHRIADKRILRLIAKWLKVGVIEDGRVTRSQIGAPQGAVISPTLANVYLHYVYDLWVQRWRRTKATGDVIVVRYADDQIVGFEHEHEAKAFLQDLHERLREFELALHPDKTRLIRFGRHAAEQRASIGEGKPETFDFLGFTHFCTRSRRWGSFVIGRKTIKKRMRAKLKAVKVELRKRMHDPIAKTGEWVKQMLQGSLLRRHAANGREQAAALAYNWPTPLGSTVSSSTGSGQSASGILISLRGMKNDGDRVRRREFIAFVGGAVAWPLSARAQQPRKIVGVLQPQAPTSPPIPFIQAFLTRLRELGWVDGQTVHVEFRGASTIERMTELAADFVRMNADVIYAPSSPQVEAANRVTKTVPIVFSTHGDPVGAGHVASLAQPGGNITGLSNLAIELAPKGLEILKETFPNANRIGVLSDATNRFAPTIMKSIGEQASKMGLRVHQALVQSEDEFEGALLSMKQAGIAVFISVTTPFLFVRRVRLLELVLEQRLAAVFTTREMVEAGALMSYGANLQDLSCRAADYVDKILRGAKPGDLPIEQASKYELVINVKTAKALGLTVPPSLLTRADEVIE